MTEGGEAGTGGPAQRRGLFGATASIALVIAAVALALVGGDDGGEETGLPVPPRIAELGDVEELASSLGHPVYWAGEPADEDLELAAEADGSVYLRYLPEGTEAGDPQQIFLTVGTYPIADAQGALRQTAEESGGELSRLAGGAVVLTTPSSPNSVYLAYPDDDLEIEVYHPDPGRAMELVRSGAIEPVGE